MATFADRLKELRTEKRITQEKLAERFFITKSAISKYENGVNTPENKLLQDMADFFEVSVDYLLGRSDKRSISFTDKLNKANTLKDELIELMIKRGIIKDINNVNEDHLKLIEMSISTYADKTNNKKQDDEN